MNLKAVDGALTIQDDIKDYIDRGMALEGMNLLDFFLTMYERDMIEPSTRGPGRPQSTHVPYLENTGNGKWCCVM